MWPVSNLTPEVELQGHQIRCSAAGAASRALESGHMDAPSLATRRVRRGPAQLAADKSRICAITSCASAGVLTARSGSIRGRAELDPVEAAGGEVGRPDPELKHSLAEIVSEAVVRG